MRIVKVETELKPERREKNGMNRKPKQHHFLGKLMLTFLVAGAPLAGSLFGQNPELQQKVAELKQQIAANQQALAQYTWLETTTISVKGKQKKQEMFQVRLGPDGKPQKTPMDSQVAGAPSGGPLKRHVVEKKKEEYEEYGDQIKELIQQYLPLNKERIEQAYSQGNVKAGPAGEPGEVRLVISNYVKPGDGVIVDINRARGGVQSLSIATYLTQPNDAVQMAVQFETIPNGPNHVASVTVNGASKQLNVVSRNSNYQKM
jgi:prefoldin subunit 5